MKKNIVALLTHIAIVTSVIITIGSLSLIKIDDEEEVSKFNGEIETNVKLRILENDTAKETGYLKELLDAFNEEYKEYGIEAVDANMDQYNAGGSENEDYYEQLLQLIEDLKNEDKRAETEGLTEEELEMFDLLIKGRKLTKEEEQKVKLAAKNLYKKLTEEKQNLFVVDWYKDEQASTTVKDAIISSLDADLPQSFDKEAFDSKINLLLNHFVDMSVQHYGWLGGVA